MSLYLKLNNAAATSTPTKVVPVHVSKISGVNVQELTAGPDAGPERQPDPRPLGSAARCAPGSRAAPARRSGRRRRKPSAAPTSSLHLHPQPCCQRRKNRRATGHALPHRKHWPCHTARIRPGTAGGAGRTSACSVIGFSSRHTTSCSGLRRSTSIAGMGFSVA
jgi:hypothetical protein